MACLWENEPSEDLIQRIVPDGCVDLIWFADRELLIEGPDTGPRLVPLPGLVRVSGIRLRPGAAAAVLGIPMSELRDHAAPVPVSLVWGEQGRRLEEALANAAPDLRLGLLAEAVGKRGAEPDTLVRATAQMLIERDIRVESIAAELGLSERHLQRRLVTSVGYGPKMLARVARLRRLLALSDRSLAARALDAGYSSQAHMNLEVRQLTGTTPVRFLKDAVFTAA